MCSQIFEWCYTIHIDFILHNTLRLSWWDVYIEDISTTHLLVVYTMSIHYTKHSLQKLLEWSGDAMEWWNWWNNKSSDFRLTKNQNQTKKYQPRRPILSVKGVKSCFAQAQFCIYFEVILLIQVIQRNFTDFNVTSALVLSSGITELTLINLNVNLEELITLVGKLSTLDVKPSIDPQTTTKTEHIIHMMCLRKQGDTTNLKRDCSP